MNDFGEGLLDESDVAVATSDETAWQALDRLLPSEIEPALLKLADRYREDFPDGTGDGVAETVTHLQSALTRSADRSPYRLVPNEQPGLVARLLRLRDDLRGRLATLDAAERLKVASAVREVAEAIGG